VGGGVGGGAFFCLHHEESRNFGEESGSSAGLFGISGDVVLKLFQSQDIRCRGVGCERKDGK
jgi:hypothetical protein